MLTYTEQCECCDKNVFKAWSSTVHVEQVCHSPRKDTLFFSETFRKLAEKRRILQHVQSRSLMMYYRNCTVPYVTHFHTGYVRHILLSFSEVWPCFIESQWNMRCPVCKCLTYENTQSPIMSFVTWCRVLKKNTQYWKINFVQPSMAFRYSYICY